MAIIVVSSSSSHPLASVSVRWPSILPILVVEIHEELKIEPDSSH